MTDMLERALSRRSAWLVATIVLVGLALTAWVARVAQHNASQTVQARFEGHVQRLEREIIARIERAEYGLRGLRGAMSMRPEMSQADFEVLVGARDMWHEFRGIRGFGVVERIEREQLPAFVSARRAAGDPTFEVATSGHHDDLFVLKYVAPREGNAQALGMDLGAEPVRRAAVEEALATRSGVLSGRVVLTQDARRGPGWVFLLPVHVRAADGVGPGRLLGLLQAPIVAREILGDVQNFTEFMLDIRLFDGPPAEGRPMLDTQAAIDPTLSAPADNAFAGRLFQAERQFSVGGRLLTLQAASRPPLEAPLVGPLRPALVMAAGGTLLTGLLAWAAWLLLRGQARARVLAERRTADLARTTADLAHSKGRLQAMLEHLPCGLGVYDRQGTLVASNALLKRLLGAEAGPGGSALESLVLTQLQAQQQSLHAALSGPRTGLEDAPALSTSHRYERTLHDGTHLEIQAAPMPDGGFVMTCVDNSAQRRAAQALRDSENLMRLVIESIPGRIVYFDSDGLCRFANAEFLAGQGLAGQEVVGRHWRALYGNPDPDPARPGRIAAALAGQRLTFEKSGIEPDGRATARLVHYIPDIRGHRVEGYFAIGLDVTELHAARDDAMRASRAKSQFVANMSHELRTPMNAVLGMLQLVQHTPLSPQQQDYVAKAEGAARTLLSVLNDVLDFSKVEAGKMTLDPRPFEVDELLRDLSVIYATSVGGKPVDVLFDLHPDVPARLVGDDMRLRQVLINLGSNAVKFTPSGQVVLRIAPVSRAEDAVTVEFSISDTGIGIEPRHLRRLFEDFGQAEASTTRRFGGTGLGLAISRKLVALMGGELAVDSEPGRGSRFSFRLVLPLAGDEGLPPVDTPGCREVLIADCKPAVMQVHAALAQALGWRVTRAWSLQEALALCAEAGRFDAVLVDWRLDQGEPLAAALRLGDRVAGTRSVVVAIGPAEAGDLLARMEPQRRRHIGASLIRPLTPRMLARAVADARAAAVPAEPARAAWVGEMGEAKPLAGLRLLVAEDNANNQLVARELLTRQGAQVDIAVHGLEALEKLRTGSPYDLVLMDWQMPVLDGLEATRAIRATPGLEGLPVVAMTANAMESDRRECLAAGMDGHLAKPIALDELVAVVLRHAREGQARARAPEPACAPAPGEALLDRATALAQLGGSVELYEQLLPMFRQDAARTMSALQQACRGGTREQAVRLAHTLKSTAGAVGAHYLARVCREAEATLSAGDSAAQEAALSALREAVAKTFSVMDAAA